MKREELRKILKKEIEKILKVKGESFKKWKNLAVLYETESNDTLDKSSNTAFNYEVGEGKNQYHVEIQILENKPSYIHVGVSICGGGWSCFFPVSSSFIVNKKGKIEK